ncbi:MAG: MFS transporter [Clostridia bacterium]|nr:MFS transporter [Clostridia bacterium]
MNLKNTGRLKAACYMTNVTMSVVGNLSPVLFMTFRDLYGISYSLLGLLVLVNFVTQLTVDLIFSFFSHKFNIPMAVKITPVLAAIGLVLYALVPFLFPNAIYAGLVISTIVFSSASGFAEVLISPTIAAIPSKDPDREMSKLHSIYAWGVVGVIVISTVFLYFVGHSYWQFLAAFFALIPIAAFLLFAGCTVPTMSTPEKTGGVLTYLKRPVLWLCVFAIFLGGATECTMAQWCSGYLEKAIQIPKLWGDIFGVALFGVMLGIGRSLYAKIGKNIGKVLFWGAIGSTLCYLISALCPIPVIGLFACAFTGFCASMMWPGSLVVAEEKLPDGGVFIFAMMAAGGDLGASVGPQLVGVITDAVIANPTAADLAFRLSMTTEQLGMKAGMLVGSLFPIVGILIFALVRRSLKKKEA